jgi:ferric-chelate reductase
MPSANATVTHALTADQKRYRAQQADYPILVWYCVAGFILLIPFWRIFYFLFRYTRTPPPLSVYRTRGSISLRRLPAAVIHSFQALAFRWTISIGKSYTLNVAQCFVSAAYMATLFTWSLVNCTLGSKIAYVISAADKTHIATSTKGVKFDPVYWANTAGNIAATQLPLVVALGMKNNIISCPCVILR